MRRSFAVLLLVSVLGCTSGPSLNANFRPLVQEPGPQIYAVIVCGPRIGAHTDGRMIDLTKAFGIVVESAYRHLQSDLKVPASHIFILDSESDSQFIHYPVVGNASLGNLEAVLQSLATTVKSSDVLIIHFACHGYTDIVALSDSKTSSSEILDALKPISGRVILVNLDSCRSGSVAKPVSLGLRNCVAIACCGAEEVGYIYGEDTFSIRFYRGFTTEEADENQDGKISVLEAYLWAYLKPGAQSPEIRTTLDPSKVFLK